MLFSKFITPLIALMSIGVAIASPVAEPAPAPAAVEARDLHARAIEARQLDSILGIVQGLESTVTPILASLTSATGAGQDVTGIIGELVSAITGATSSLGGLGGGTPLGLGSATAVVTVVIQIIVSIVGVLGNLSVAANLLAQVDAVLGPFLTTLNSLIPGVTGLIGSGLPGASLIPLALSQLTSVIGILGLLSILSPILGLLGLL
ncbi:hypothetical protein BXZ70DRAFT_1004031 [Cristinia sonorae]|uniref:Uncharacterized protein n=1 Tax=Cristinia sonorae TaxID=1940300 RepID=A0A8K0UYX8_9AGAR|nr:hypothetical protein BXZ70DRAFT_1004031 [Cristinia sonorae]